MNFLEILGFFGPWLTSAIIAFVSLRAFNRNRLKDRISALEQNFDILQRLNEIALQSDDNLEAAIKSVRPDDKVDLGQARINFFHYLRINRLMRAYEYWRIGALPQEDIDRIFDNYVGCLKEAIPLIRNLGERGYPDDFVDHLIDRVMKAPQPTPMDAYNYGDLV